jgi:hypothetical protein
LAWPGRPPCRGKAKKRRRPPAAAAGTSRCACRARRCRRPKGSLALSPHVSASRRGARQSARAREPAAGFRFPRGRPAPSEIEPEIYRCSCCVRVWTSHDALCLAASVARAAKANPRGQTVAVRNNLFSFAPGLACLVTHAHTRLGRDRKRMRVCRAPLASGINN